MQMFFGLMRMNLVRSQTLIDDYHSELLLTVYFVSSEKIDLIEIQLRDAPIREARLIYDFCRKEEQ